MEGLGVTLALLASRRLGCAEGLANAIVQLLEVFYQFVARGLLCLAKCAHLYVHAALGIDLNCTTNYCGIGTVRTRGKRPLHVAWLIDDGPGIRLTCFDLDTRSCSKGCERLGNSGETNAIGARRLGRTGRLLALTVHCGDNTDEEYSYCNAHGAPFVAPNV